MLKKIARSVGAVLAGFITVAALSVVTDQAMEALHIFPPVTQPEATADWMLAIALAYRSLYTVAGGYLTARLAKDKPMRHVAALMVLGGIGGVVGMVAGWSFGHHWYCILIAVTGPLFVWVGGKMCKPKTVRETASQVSSPSVKM